MNWLKFIFALSYLVLRFTVARIESRNKKKEKRTNFEMRVVTVTGALWCRIISGSFHRRQKIWSASVWHEMGVKLWRKDFSSRLEVLLDCVVFVLLIDSEWDSLGSCFLWPRMEMVEVRCLLKLFSHRRKKSIKWKCRISRATLAYTTGLERSNNKSRYWKFVLFFFLIYCYNLCIHYLATCFKSIS